MDESVVNEILDKRLKEVSEKIKHKQNNLQGLNEILSQQKKRSWTCLLGILIHFAWIWYAWFGNNLPIFTFNLICFTGLVASSKVHFLLATLSIFANILNIFVLRY